MEKLLKILHKKMHIKEHKEYFKKQSKVMESLFSFDKIPYVQKDEFDFYKNEIIYHGIINKQAIEKAYKEARIQMADYYDVLNYEQKLKLMDYEIKKSLQKLICFVSCEQNIYIPFFDKELNRIYENEMTLFDLKKYADIMLYYHFLMKQNLYGYDVYKSSFSSLEYISEKDGYCALYCIERKKLYFLKDYKMIDSISFEKCNIEHFKKIFINYINKDVVSMIEDLYHFAYIDEKLYKTLLKKRK